MPQPSAASPEEVLLRRLVEGPLYWFCDWPNAAVPVVAAGVYSVWRDSELVYVGMSGRGLSAADLERHRNDQIGERGLSTRLASHSAGRRSGDQFCVYVADRLVLPLLSSEDIASIAAGEISLDQRVREFIHRELSYRFTVVEDGRAALDLERRARAGELSCGLPLLNPPKRLTRGAKVSAQPTFLLLEEE